MVSTMPIDVYRTVNRIDVEVAKPPMLFNPGGENVDILEWLYSSQDDLDGFGNTFGLITELNALGLPARIDLQPASECSVRGKGSDITEYRICGKGYKPQEVWHEKQYTVSGIPVGLAPVMYSAWTISAGLSAMEFAADWFSGGAVPTATLKNTKKELKQSEAVVIKNRFKAAVTNHDVFVTGNDWEYDMIGIPANQTNFIEMMDFSVVDICRFFGAPADLIDAQVSGQSVTYANISQRNLQFLIMNLQPVLKRRENALTKWTPRGQKVRFNGDALLRMDPETRARVIGEQITNRTVTNDEARALDNKPPLTDEEIARMNLIYGPPKSAATPAGAKA